MAMKPRQLRLGAVLWLLAPLSFLPAARAHTTVEIRGGDFWIDGHPTYEGRTYQGHRIEGLLFNARVVQGTFDDLNPATQARWAYPDTHRWDPERNTDEFVAAMPEWRRRGLLAFTLNLQGGSPLGYGGGAWVNTAFEPDGSLRAPFMARLDRILRRADELGMAAIVGLYYFGQEGTLRDDAAVIRGADQVTAWLFDRGYRNVLIEICNETSPKAYKLHPILQPAGIPRLEQRIRQTERAGYHYPVGVSFSGGVRPTPEIAQASDFILIHGNGKSPDSAQRLRDLIAATRALPGFRPMPIVVNEDDHYDFDRPDNDLLAATAAHVSWGFFDYRRADEAFAEGYQSPPVDWRISSERKRAFFSLVKQITGN